MNEYIYFTEIFLNALGIFDFGVRRSGIFKVMLHTIIAGTCYLTGVFELFTISNNFSHFAENFSMLLVGFTAFVKFYTLVYTREKIKNLRALVESNKVSGQELKNDHHSIIEHYDQIGLRFSKNYLWILCASVQGLLLQILPAIYPFSLNSTPMFTIAYIHQAISTYIFALIYLAFDSWFLFLIHHACGHFCLLQNLLEKIADTEQQPLQIRKRIVSCVRLHQNIYKFSDYIEDIFNLSNLMQFLVSSVAICISGYNIVTMGLGKPQILVKHLSSVIAQVVQLLVFNWCGQLIEEKSLGVSHAISKSNLYKLGIDHQRDLGLILLRAQKPTHITAGKFSNLSLRNFSDLIKTSISYFTVLTSIQEC